VRRWPTVMTTLGLLTVLATLSGGRHQGHRPNVKSAERALLVLQTLSKNACTFTELLQILKFPRSSLHGLLVTLVQLQWVELRPDKRYRVIATLTPTAETV